MVNSYTPQKDKSEDDYLKDVLEKIKDLNLVGKVVELYSTRCRKRKIGNKLKGASL